METAENRTNSRTLTRVINGTLYARDVEPYAFETRIHRLGDRMVEATALPVYGWHEVDALTPQAAQDYARCLDEQVPLSPQELLDRAAQYRERSSRRARTQVRRLCKVKSLTTMLTFTYAENMQDRERIARDWDRVVKRIKRVIPGFEYICVFERQKRGAWHAHVAVRKIASHYVHQGALVKSYDLLRAIWRGVVGANNGTCNVSDKNRKIRGSIAKLAKYMTKYIGKHFDENEKYGNSYSASGRALPGPEVERVLTTSQSEAVSRLLDRLSAELGGGPVELHQAYLDGGGYFLSLSPPSR